MNRPPRAVAFALLASLLVVTAMPVTVGASSHNESLASVHTTDADFNAATTAENLTVSGTGAGASLALADLGDADAATVDDVEDGDIAEYGGDTGVYSAQQATALEGAWSIEAQPSSSPAAITSTSGLGTYPEPGDRFRFRLQGSDMGTGGNDFASGMFGVQSEAAVGSRSGYQAGIRGDDTLVLWQIDSGSSAWGETASASIASDTPYEIEIDWQADGTINATLYRDATGNDEFDTAVASVSRADTTYTSGGIGWTTLGQSTAYYDYYRLRGTPAQEAHYVSQTHDASRPTTAWTNLTLDNATADVTWLADTNADGTFETTAASNTFTSTGNHTLDVSGTDADAWRVNVSYETTGTNPTARLDDEGLLFQARDPVASNLDPDAETIDGDNDVQLSVDVADADFATEQGDSVEVEFTFDGQVVDTQQVTSNGTVTTTVDDVQDGSYVWNVSLTDDYGGTTQSGDATVTLDHHAPTLTNPQPADGTTLSAFDTNLSVDVADGDFPESWGDGVTVTFYDTGDGTVIGQQTVAANQTVEVTWSDLDRGSNTWNATASDEYGNAASLAEMEVVTPNELVVREEPDPQTIVNDTTLTIRFYTAGGEIAIQRETTDGTLNMTGLPGSDLVVFAEADSYYDRRVYIADVFDQQDVFLLNSTESPRAQDEAFASRFQYTDLTGDFPRSETTIEVQRALDVNGDGTSEFRTVAGDFWGAGGEFETILEQGQRYRLTVTNRETGESMILGTHVPTADLVHDVRTSGLVLGAANASGVYANAGFNESAGAVEIAYADPTDGTEELEVRIVPQTGGDPIFNETVDGPLGTYARSVALNQSQQEQNWVVEFESDRHRAAIPVGSGSVGLPVAVPGWLLALLMSMAVTFVGALYGPRTALLGSWAMVFVAAGVMMFGWAFSFPSVVVAALVAIGATFYARGTI